MPNRNDTWIPIGYARFGTLSSAVILGSTAPTAGTAYGSLTDLSGRVTEPRHATITVETQDVRMRPDGTSPTSSEGELVGAGGTITISDSPDVIRKLRVIETTSGAAITVLYFV